MPDDEPSSLPISGQPGAVVMPGGSVSQLPQQPQVAPSSPAPTPATLTENSTDEVSAPVSDEDYVSWTAPEFVKHEKTAGWYIVLVIIGLVIGAAIYAVSHDIVSIVIVLLGVMALGYYASRNPQDIPYVVSETGVEVGKRQVPYPNLKSFSVVREGDLGSIILMPLRRFAPLVTLYFDPQHEEEIVNFIAQFLPVADYKHDVLERLLQRARF